MNEVGAFEAKNKLSALLDEVEQGAEITITRRGRPAGGEAGTCRDHGQPGKSSARRQQPAGAQQGRNPGRVEDQGSCKRGPAVSLVIDSSVTLSWCFQDERTDAAAHLLHRVPDTAAAVPGLWRLDVANGLQMALRRGRIDAAYRDATIADLRALAIEVDPERDRRAWSEILQLADRFRLTSYDAAYLELAQRRGLPLASLDGELRAAAKAAGVELTGV